MGDIIIECLRNVALYAIPILNLLFSILALVKANRINKVEEKLREYDIKLKEYELEKIEKEKDLEKEANIEAKIIKISEGKYKIRIFNSGAAIAYNVDYDIPKEYNIITFKEVTPFEYLEPGKSFDEHVIIHHQSSHKYLVKTTWKDRAGDVYNNECLNAW